MRTTCEVLKPISLMMNTLLNICGGYRSKHMPHTRKEVLQLCDHKTIIGCVGHRACVVKRRSATMRSQSVSR